jgi:hypothetical protein
MAAHKLSFQHSYLILTWRLPLLNPQREGEERGMNMFQAKETVHSKTSSRTDWIGAAGCVWGLRGFKTNTHPFDTLLESSSVTAQTFRRFQGPHNVWKEEFWAFSLLTGLEQVSVPIAQGHSDPSAPDQVWPDYSESCRRKESWVFGPPREPPWGPHHHRALCFCRQFVGLPEDLQASRGPGVGKSEFVVWREKVEFSPVY